MIKDLNESASAGVSLDELRARLEGTLCLPGENGYAEAVFAWNVMTTHRPELVVVAESEADVQAAVDFARARGMKIAVQNTGHGQFRACEGGMLIVVSQMRVVVVDPETGTARLQAGARWADVLAPAQAAGYAALSGSSPGVGVVGYTLGGGYNLLLRTYGLAIDRVTSMRVVTMDGRVTSVSRNENGNLFWALLGGGGAFGIITEMEIGLIPNPTVFGGSIMFPIERASEVFAAYHSWSEALPDSVTSAVDIMHFPPLPIVPEPLRDQCVVIVNACAATDEATGEALMAPIRALPVPIMDDFCAFPYSESARVYKDPVDPLPVMSHGVLLKDVDGQLLDKVLKAAGPMQISPNLKINLRQLGGAVAKTDGACAVGTRRQATHLLHMLGVPMGPVTPDMIREQAARILSAIEPYILSYGPLNFVGENNVTGEMVRNVVGDETLKRLQAVKKTYDPDNLLCHASVGLG